MWANPNDAIDITDQHPQDWEKSVPLKNDDGSYSFYIFHGIFSRAMYGVGREVRLQHQFSSWDTFFFETKETTLISKFDLNIKQEPLYCY